MDDEWISPRLLALEEAHVCTRGAWLYAEDREQRALAIEVCARINLDYLEMVAATMEHTGASAGTARRHVAESLRREADAHYALCATEPTGANVPDNLPAWVHGGPDDLTNREDGTR